MLPFLNFLYFIKHARYSQTDYSGLRGTEFNATTPISTILGLKFLFLSPPPCQRLLR